MMRRPCNSGKKVMTSSKMGVLRRLQRPKNAIIPKNVIIKRYISVIWYIAVARGSVLE